MQAVIFGLFMPVIPLLIWERHHKDRKPSKAELIGRYVVYTLIITAMASVVMVFLCDENTSFFEKMDKSPVFVLKYGLVVFVAAVVTSVAEKLCTARKIVLVVDGKQWAAWKPIKFVRKFLFPAGLFLLAAFVVVLNALLVCDNVLWGDEAYAANLIRNDISGIFQVLTLEENHPPLYYLWLKLFAELFGYAGTVYHLASFVPFVAGILLAVTCFRRRFGNMPAALFVILSGMAAPCLEYNMEIRMYALAFLGVAGSFYCAYRILHEPKKAAPWIGIVLWSLVAAYSHYYALVAVGILQFITFVLAFVKFRGKIWIKGAAALLIFIGAYLPWLSQLFRATKSVSGNWWMEEPESLSHSMSMIGCGQNMSRWILPLLALVALALFLSESSFFSVEKKGERSILKITPPSLKAWSDETYAFAAGLLTIVGTLLFAYGISALMTPLVALRYLYPLCAVTALLVAVGIYRLLQRLKEIGEKRHLGWLLPAGKTALFLALVLLFVTGISDYKSYSALVRDEKAKTEETLNLIGDAGKGVELVNNGITHIGWTVLHYYYPEAQVVNGDYHSPEGDDFWYFTPDYLSEEEISELGKEGFGIDGYGEKQISKYPFVLYHFVRQKSAALR
ncbi:MAG: glycosyltransferase family 39 protein [Bacteroidales bacterium]|nr:glycosyltransferase family 39 protein [Lachnoclostridium sp.]MCM1384453.1 glycosyltransferase family 39 protein [Lachnoclostridium sp.]MCM1465233.1 glycosyltransferase family 39 protein [Bacteroidales bacterium]